MLIRITKSILIISTVCIFSDILFASSDVSQEQVTSAVGVSYEAHLKFGIPCIMGKESEGVQFDRKNNLFTYSNCDLTDPSESEAVGSAVYTRMSGKVEFLQNRLMIFDVTLTGGPVESLKYEVDLRTVKKLASSGSRSYPVEVEANGTKYTVDLVKAIQQKK